MNKPIHSPIVFSHANGFPAGCYSYFFDQFSEYSIGYIPKSGLNISSIETGWESLRDELILFIESNYTEAVIGLGHSMGAVFFLLAAEKRPDLFSQVILMDPPIMGNELRSKIAQKQEEGTVYDVLSVAQKAKIRKDKFPSLEIVKRVMKGKSLFKKFHPQCFQDYLESAYTQNEDGSFRLSYPKELEYQIFCTIPPFDKALDIQIPVKYIYANSGEIYDSRIHGIEELRELIPNAEFVSFDGGHLFPMEQPEEVAKLVQRLINKSN